MKIYLEKFNKGYGRLLKKFEEEIGELGREVELGRPIDRYVEVARRAF